MPEEVQAPPRRRYIKVEVAHTAQGIEEAEALAIDLNQDITDWRNGKAFDWGKWDKPKKRHRSDWISSRRCDGRRRPLLGSSICLSVQLPACLSV